MIDVKDHFEIQIVKGINLFGRMRKGVRVEFERAMAGVPAIGAIAGAQIDERVAGKLLLAKRARDLERLFRAGQGAM